MMKNDTDRLAPLGAIANKKAVEYIEATFVVAKATDFVGHSARIDTHGGLIGSNAVNIPIYDVHDYIPVVAALLPVVLS